MRMACLYSLTARSRWPVTSKILPKIDMRPDFGPFGIKITVDGGTEFVGGRLIVVLFEEQFANAVMRQRTVAVDFQRLSEIRAARFGNR